MEHLDPEYLCLFHAITEAIEELERLKADLMAAQRRAEALYMERTDKPCALFIVVRSYADKKTHARAIGTHGRVFWFQGEC